MKVLFLSKYSRMGASSRYRSFQYLPYLKAHGLDCIIQSLLDDNYLRNLHLGQQQTSAILSALWQRCTALRKQIDFDLIVLEKELFPFVPFFLERFLGQLKVPWIVDYDDALFHRYDCHRNPIIRFLMKQKIANVMRYANAVVVGNGYLGDYARSTGAAKVFELPTVIDLEKYDKIQKRQNDQFNIGWIGSSTTTEHLKTIAPVLRTICSEGEVELLLVGAKRTDWLGSDTKMIPWSEESEVETIRQMDVGVMPLPDSPWERGKCGFKLIQYMACGLPVIASPVGVNKEIVEHGVNGFLASTEKEWVEAFDALRNSFSLRCKMGTAGRAKVERTYSLQVTAPLLLEIFKAAAGERR